MKKAAEKRPGITHCTTEPSCLTKNYDLTGCFTCDGTSKNRKRRLSDGGGRSGVSTLGTSGNDGSHLVYEVGDSHVTVVAAVTATLQLQCSETAAG